MSSNQSPENKFVGYEYKRVTVPKELDGLWADSLEPFGWTLDKKGPAVVKHLWGPLRVMAAPLAVFGGKFKEAVVDHDSSSHEELAFRRDKEIPDRAELNRLQSQFENSAKRIEGLEDSKTAGAAYAIGLAGTVFMGVSVFSYLAAMTPAFIVAAVPGLLGWILPFFAYRAIKNRKTQRVDPLIEVQHDNIRAVCQKAAEITCVV